MQPAQTNPKTASPDLREKWSAVKKARNVNGKLP